MEKSKKWMIRCTVCNSIPLGQVEAPTQVAAVQTYRFDFVDSHKGHSLKAEAVVETEESGKKTIGMPHRRAMGRGR